MQNQIENMSFENNDDRIERLEERVKAQEDFSQRVCKWLIQFAEGQRNENSNMLALALRINMDLLGLKKLILTQPIFGSADVRAKFMAEVNQQQLDIEKLIQGLKDCASKQPPPPLLPPLP